MEENSEKDLFNVHYNEYYNSCPKKRPYSVQQLNKQVTLKRKGEVRDMYLKIPFPLNFKIFFFNVTNPSDIQNGSTPIVKEVGPYWYDEYIEKVDVVDNDTEDSLIYSPRFQYHFNQVKSGRLSQDDYVTIIHPIIVGMVNKVEADLPTFLSSINKALIEIFNGTESIYLIAKVRDILFDGIQLNCDVKGSIASIVCQQLKSSIPGIKSLPDNEKVFLFSLFGRQNGTIPKRYKVLRGTRKSKDVGRLISVDGVSRTNLWTTPKCNRFVGTDGWIFPPLMEPNHSLKTYSPDLCRNVEAKPDIETMMKGIHVRTYEADLGDQTNNLEDKCYCNSPNSCLKKGVFSLNKCLQVPILATLPHFLKADQEYLEQVQGLNPDPEKHKLIIYFEPMTGTPLFAAKRMQLNLEIKSIPQIDLFKNLPTALHPVLWLEETVDLDGEWLDRVKSVFKMIHAGHVALWIFLVLAAVGLGATFFLYKKGNRQFNLNQVHEVRPPAKLYNGNNRNDDGDVKQISAYDNPVLSGHEFDKY